MCGLFGFVGTEPNMRLLSEIANLASTRGVHGWGIAGKSRIKKGEGKLEDQLNVLYHFQQEPYIIGHCRLATFGNYTRITQPLVFPYEVVAHNGNVYSFKELAKQLNYEMKTDCDSEIIGAMLQKGYSLQEIASHIDSPYAILIRTPQGMFAIRKGLPLFMSRRPEGVYLCSRKFENSTPLEEEVEHSFLAHEMFT